METTLTPGEQKIVEYYEHCDADYKLVWHLNTHMAMHYGYWDGTITRLRQALVLMNIKLAELGQIKSSDHVLDAGCGVGGSSVFMAKNIGCRVTGITLVPKQVGQCNENARKNLVSDLVHFVEANYCRTGFDDKSFDVVWGIESVCYAVEKMDFIEEAYRLLKPGGRLVVADFFSRQTEPASPGFLLMKQMANSWALDSFEVAEVFKDKMQKAGFKNIKMRDVTQNVYPSIRRLHYYYYPGVVCDAVLRWLGLRKAVHRQNLLSTYYQYEAYKQGLWSYNFFYGEK